MTFISYAQNYEDVILARAFPGKTNGFYVDVGACFPDIGSVTKHFYDLGWQGVNVEPHPDAFRLLEAYREKDINLNIAIAEHDGEIKLYYGNSVGETTALGIDDDKSFMVPALSLKSLFEKYVHNDVDFLKIDVEGYEYEVLRSGNWKKFRPKIIICEVTHPWSNELRPEAKKINALLSKNNYSLTYFDGLNWYFVALEASDLMEVINLQPNVLDNFVSSVQFTLSTQLASAQVEQERIHQHLDEVRIDREQIRQQLDGVRADRERIRQQLDEVWADRERILASRFWRITAPLRAIIRRARAWRDRLINLKSRIFSLSALKFKELIKAIVRRLVQLLTKLLRFVAPGFYTRLSTNERLRRVYARFSRTNTLVSVTSFPQNSKLEVDFGHDLQRAVQEWRLGERIDD